MPSVTERLNALAKLLGQHRINHNNIMTDWLFLDSFPFNVCILFHFSSHSQFVLSSYMVPWLQLSCVLLLILPPTCTQPLERFFNHEFYTYFLLSFWKPHCAHHPDRNLLQTDVNYATNYATKQTGGNAKF